jgi:hypothetical protein
VVQLHRDVERIHVAGAELVVIGNGAPHFIAGFRDQTGYRGPLYTDPSLKVYEAAHLERGFVKTLNMRSLVPTIKAFAGGHRQGSTQGDNFQQGGVLVIAPSGVVKWHHISKRPGDHATVDEIVRALA